jgi:hypothetical protein
MRPGHGKPGDQSGQSGERVSLGASLEDQPIPKGCDEDGLTWVIGNAV